MLEKLITKALDIIKSETAAKLVLKIGVAAYAAYFHKDLDAQTVAYIGAMYLAASAAIDAAWHKKHPEVVEK